MAELTLEGLEVLDAIDRRGSFAAAAAALYRVPSKVTYTVRKLEEDLGVTLFRREGRRSVLTPAGRVLLEQGRELLQAAERLAESTRQAERGWESTLRVALDSVLEFEFLGGALDALYREQPNIEVQVGEEVLGGSWEAIKQHRVDLVIGAPELDIPTPGISTAPLCAVDMVYAVAANHPLATVDGPVERDSLRAHRAVIVGDSSRELPALSLRVLAEQPHLRVASIAQKIEAQRLGLGVGFLPRFRVEHLLASGALKEIELAEPFPGSRLHVAWHTANRGRALTYLREQLLADHG